MSKILNVDGEVYIGYPTPDLKDRRTSFISLPLVEFDNSSHAFYPEELILIFITYYHSQKQALPNYHAAIAWEYLPSVDRLIQAYDASEYGCVPNTGPFFGLYRAFKEFADKYCSKMRAFPLVRKLYPHRSIVDS